MLIFSNIVLYTGLVPTEWCLGIINPIYKNKGPWSSPDVVRDLTVSLNNLLADFSFVDSSTLSGLFDSHCMNLYGSQLFRYNDIKSMELLYVTWRKSIIDFLIIRKI